MIRRRFLALSAAALTLGAGRADAVRWRGVVLGAPASITLRGGPRDARAAVAAAVAALRRVEAVVSLHDPGSALARLNREGRLDDPPRALVAVLRLAGAVHAATGGRFDPTVQPLWRALAEGRDPGPARHALGWDRVALGAGVALGPGQALTLNGIAQGWAADRAAEALGAHGFERALVDAGEMRGLSGPWRVGLEDPGAGSLGRLTLEGGAVATSSPGALSLPDGSGHILDPRGGGPVWSSVTVEAEGAALADAASTALCLLERDAARRAAARLGLRRVIAVDARGDLTTLV